MSSGTSTPRGTRSPPPPEGGGQQASSGGPSPLTIGKRFVKQYYQALMTSPEQIHRFYQPASVLSDGDGSTPTDPVTFESAYAAEDGSAEKLQDRFFIKDLQIRFEFEHGAIDAQQSVNGGLLLVVTGHVVYYPTVSEDEDAAVDDPIRKGFVHTFFLNSNTLGTKKSYYVHNDILRFLKNTSEVSASISESAAVVTEPAPPTVMKESTPTPPAPEPEPAPPPPPETKPPVPETQQPPASSPVVETSEAVEKIVVTEESVDEAPGGGVEETKEEPPAPTPPAPVAKPVIKDDKPSAKDIKPVAGSPKKEASAAGKDGGSKVSKGSHRSNKPQQQQQGGKDSAPDAGRKSPVPLPSPAPKPAPGSWASLVAGAGAGGGSIASGGSAVKGPPPVSVKPPPKPAPTSSEKPPTHSSNDKKEMGGVLNLNTGSSSNSNTGGTSHKMGNTGGMGGRPKRDPDCTLVIKNLAEHTKEADVLTVFEPFAAQTKSRVVGITVAAHRGIAFVDFDSINPVIKAVNLHKEEPMRLFGRVLEVDQKTAEQRARRAAQQQRGERGGGGGGSYRSGSPSNGGANRYGSGGGRGGHRRGRGDRGGGGMGGRGGRGGR